MEEKIAIMMADLAGYTALTETHGAMRAADIIEKYLQIVKHSLAGSSYLHDNTGDEVMIVSHSADDLLTTAKNIMMYSSAENNFLQLHGGLHYGQIIQRNNRFFGTAVNLTSRITAQARPGTFWCSEDFILALQQNSAAGFRAKGSHQFKNIRESREVFELVADDHQQTWIDPVCKMRIREKGHAVTHPIEKNIVFCDTSCLDFYMENAVA